MEEPKNLILNYKSMLWGKRPDGKSLVTRRTRKRLPHSEEYANDSFGCFTSLRGIKCFAGPSIDIES